LPIRLEAAPDLDRPAHSTWGRQWGTLVPGGGEERRAFASPAAVRAGRTVTYALLWNNPNVIVTVMIEVRAYIDASGRCPFAR
jgi:hypothetical protein